MDGVDWYEMDCGYIFPEHCLPGYCAFLIDVGSGL